MVINVSKKQFDFLNYYLSEDRKLLWQKLKSSEGNQGFLIELDENAADEICDWANEELQKKGFNAEYALTPEGIILEELVDLFNVE